MKGIWPVKKSGDNGGSPDGVAPSQMVGVSSSFVSSLMTANFSTRALCQDGRTDAPVSTVQRGQHQQLRVDAAVRQTRFSLIYHKTAGGKSL